MPQIRDWFCHNLQMFCDGSSRSGAYAPELHADHVGAVLVTTLLAALLVTSYRRPKN